MRDNLWLENRLDSIWGSYFGDVVRGNEVYVKFGQDARTRLGSIRKLGKSSTLITVTGFFKDERVPQYVIDLTIAHELCHYAHGFFSPLPRLSRHPHQGGLVNKELVKRGFGNQLLAQKKWLKEEWPNIIGVKIYRKRRVIRRKKYTGFELFKILISG